MRLILHVGTPKTGTTTIQNFFNSNQSNIYKETGIYYPKNGCFLGAHHNIAYELIGLMRKTKYQPQRGSFSQAMQEAKEAGAQECLISSEAFYSIENSDLESLKEKIKKFDIYIIIYFRSQEQFIQSGYQQILKFGRTSDNLIDHWKKHLHLGYYHKFIEKINKFFPNAEITIKTYKKSKNFNLLDDFFKALNKKIKLESYPTEKLNSNSTPGIKHLSFIRGLLKYKLLNQDELPPNSFFIELSQYFKKSGTDKHKYSILNYEEALQIYNFYRISNQLTGDMIGAQYDFLGQYPSITDYLGIPNIIEYDLMDVNNITKICNKYNVGFKIFKDANYIFS